MAQFVAGYAQILQSKDIGAFKVSERHKHLIPLNVLCAAVHLVGHSQFPWSILLEIA